ncbi:MAG: DUF4382 domain-containing protein [Gemmatimonadaceae bacterium]
MIRKISRAVLGSLMAVTAVTACSDTTGSNTGKLTVKLTDAPFPFAEVSSVDMWVVRIDARTQSVSEAEASDASDTGGWTTIASPNALINLLSLQGGVTTNLGTTSLATGNYNGFRLILDTQKSSVTLKDGTVLTGGNGIIFPSAAQTGIKINLDAPIQITQDSSVMILDFDVGSSFVMRGNSIKNNGLLFKPVIRAVATELTGVLTGSVRSTSATGPGVAGATVDVLKDGTALADTVAANVVASTSTDASGNYRFSFLLPGAYEVRATPPAASGFLPALLPDGVTITSGATVADKVIVVVP